MMNATETAQHLIDLANGSGSAQSTISARILVCTAMGMTMAEAVDAVLGAGTYARVAGEVYDTLRAKGG
jgi:hypothetical protein